MQGGDPRAERFWLNVEKTEGCWLWKGGMSGEYGRIMFDRTLYLAHRLSWELANGRPPVQQVLHTCDTPPCVRPDHLYEGTQSQNILDAVARGRHPRNRGGAKLNWEDAMIIRERVASGERRGAIAQEYGVCRDTIEKLVMGQTWNTAT